MIREFRKWKINSDYSRQDWDILSFIDGDGNIITEIDKDFNKYLNLHLEIDKTHPCGGPSYECEIKINSVRNNVNNEILKLGENTYYSSITDGSCDHQEFRPIVKLWVNSDIFKKA
jgi:hypothetical protein